MSTKNQVKCFAWKILYIRIVYLENEKVLFLARSRQVTEFRKWVNMGHSIRHLL